MAWIVYKKAYDIVLRSWIQKCLVIVETRGKYDLFIENQYEKLEESSGCR